MGQTPHQGSKWVLIVRGMYLWADNNRCAFCVTLKGLAQERGRVDTELGALLQIIHLRRHHWLENHPQIPASHHLQMWDVACCHCSLFIQMHGFIVVRVDDLFVSMNMQANTTSYYDTRLTWHVRFSPSSCCTCLIQRSPLFSSVTLLSNIQS